MLLAILLLTAAAGGQEPASKPELSIIDAKLGTCSADFTIKDADGKAVYAAMVHVRIRYGFMGLKRMDLEVGTNSDGRARVAGLPLDKRPLAYDVAKGDKKATANQDQTTSCRAVYELSLK